MRVLKVSTAFKPELTKAMTEPLPQKILLKSGISILRLHVALNVKGKKVIYIIQIVANEAWQQLI